VLWTAAAPHQRVGSEARYQSPIPRKDNVGLRQDAFRDAIGRLPTLAGTVDTQ